MINEVSVEDQDSKEEKTKKNETVLNASADVTAPISVNDVAKQNNTFTSSK